MGSSIQALGSNPWPYAHFTVMNVTEHNKTGKTKGYENVNPRFS